MFEICFNCDGWYEDEDLSFPTREAAEARLHRMFDELADDAEMLWATDADGEPVLIANAEHWTLVSRVVPAD